MPPWSRSRVRGSSDATEAIPFVRHRPFRAKSPRRSAVSAASRRCRRIGQQPSRQLISGESDGNAARDVVSERRRRGSQKFLRRVPDSARLALVGQRGLIASIVAMRPEAARHPCCSPVSCRRRAMIVPFSGRARTRRAQWRNARLASPRPRLQTIRRRRRTRLGWFRGARPAEHRAPGFGGATPVLVLQGATDR